MRWLLAIPLFIFGAFLFSLTIDQIGIAGSLMLKIIGLGIIFVAGKIAGNKKKHPS